MRRWIGMMAVGLSLAGRLPGQMPLDPERVPEALAALNAERAGPELACDIRSYPAHLNYDFRFQSGYDIAVPLKHLAGQGNALQVFVRVASVAPQVGVPVFLEQAVELPDVPARNRAELEMTGGYYLGTGKYSIDLAIVDHAGRTCRKHWRVETKPSGSERSVPLALAPGAVAPFTFETWKHEPAETSGRPLRVTVFLHAIPLSRRTVSLRMSDQEMLLGSLASLRAQMPGARLKVVAFNLDQQKEIFRDPVFQEEGWDNLLEAMEKEQLGTVSYKTLQRSDGHLDLLNKLIGDEINAPEPAEAVIFLGPTARQTGKQISPLAARTPGLGPQFFYFEYKPYWRSGNDFPDVVYRAIRQLSGKTFRIRSPSDFATAVQALRTALDLHHGSVATAAGFAAQAYPSILPR
jgi:hypothetical protein